jgi:hypothetical protein
MVRRCLHVFLIRRRGDEHPPRYDAINENIKALLTQILSDVILMRINPLWETFHGHILPPFGGLRDILASSHFCAGIFLVTGPAGVVPRVLFAPGAEPDLTAA